MNRNGAAGVIAVCAALLCVQSARADIYPVIVIGKVTMQDGSPPPFAVSIERLCDDLFDLNGPLVDKHGQWIWRLNVDLYQQHACVFKAHHEGYTSTTIDASNINLNYLDKTVHVPDIVMSPAVPDPYTIRTSGDDFPARAKAPFNRAMQDIDTRRYDEAIAELKAAVLAAPKFGAGWHALGVVYDRTGLPVEARNAFQKAVDADPKLLTAYVALTRTCVVLKDWRCTADTSERMIRSDVKHLYPEIYLHLAVARFELKDLAAAEQSVNEFIRLDTAHKIPRAEFVLGRILEGKGDIDGARQHMTKYLLMEPAPRDLDLVQGHVSLLGKPDAAQVNPELELL